MQQEARSQGLMREALSAAQGFTEATQTRKDVRLLRLIVWHQLLKGQLLRCGRVQAGKGQQVRAAKRLGEALHYVRQPVPSQAEERAVLPGMQGRGHGQIEGTREPGDLQGNERQRPGAHH